MAIISLLTDFGIQDEFTGVLKGVILSIDSGATIVDITHSINPQDVEGACLTLKAAYPFFPKGTIHVAVVDPGVGTQRAVISALCDGHFFLAPDNGLLYPILRHCSTVRIRTVENETLFRHPVSRTFHGRDIFAPVAAWLSKGIDFESLGQAITLDRILPLNDQRPRIVNDEKIEGCIVAIDRFGNLITNIHSKDLKQMQCPRRSFKVGEYTIDDISETYAENKVTGPIAILGSRGYVEISIFLGNAAHTLKLGKGDIVRVIGSHK